MKKKRKLVKRNRKLEKKNEENRLIIALQEQIIAELRSKKSYLDTILDSEGLVGSEQIARDYGLTMQELVNIINEENHHFWIIDGIVDASLGRHILDDGSRLCELRWTKKGRLYFHEVLAQHGIVALIDRVFEREVMFSSKTDLWETPQDLFDRLDEEFHFDIDVCALPENTKCKKFFTPEQDGLSQPWCGMCWCNPPYGRQIGQWVRRGFLSSAAGSTVVMLLPARTDTKWFHEYIYGKKRVQIWFLKGRLKFGGCKNSAPFPSMIVVFKPNE